MDTATSMDEIIKVAIILESDEEQAPKIWRFKRSLVDSYKLSAIEEELATYFPEVQRKNLTVILKYKDSFLKRKIKIESDSDLHVSHSISLNLLTQRSIWIANLINLHEL